LADEYRFRFKRNTHLVKNFPRQRGYTVRDNSNGRIVTYINLLNHSGNIIQDICDSLEEEDLHSALWRIIRRHSRLDLHRVIDLMIPRCEKKKRSHKNHKRAKRLSFCLGLYNIDKIKI